MKKTTITTTSTDFDGTVTTETVETIEEGNDKAARRPTVVQFYYHGKYRVVEAFEIKFAPGTRNILLVGQEVGCDHPKAFIVDEILNADFTGVRFVALGAERK